jgi:hypothetical protein
MAATREDTCGVEGWMFNGLSVHDSLGILLSVFPANYKRLVDCDLAAHNCKEVEDCEKYYFLDHVKYADMGLPECGSDPSAYCEGNVVKYCESDDGDKTFYQVSYDCALAGATCAEWQTESGGRSADCQAPPLECAGPEMPYCDGTRAVACEQNGGPLSPLSPWVYDCAGAFGSHCLVNGENVKCEGPETGEEDCYDGKDGDGDGKIDCMDDDCWCAHEHDCEDGLDNESDGKVDCDDDDCESYLNCQ